MIYFSERSAPGSGSSPAGFIGKWMRLRLLTCWLPGLLLACAVVCRCPAADPATALAARSLLLDAQTIGNTVIDGSVRHRLEELREKLQSVRV